MRYISIDDIHELELALPEQSPTLEPEGISCLFPPKQVELYLNVAGKPFSLEQASGKTSNRNGLNEIFLTTARGSYVRYNTGWINGQAISLAFSANKKELCLRVYKDLGSRRWAKHKHKSVCIKETIFKLA